jgi:MauM/NapG family ferredoxin protein
VLDRIARKVVQLGFLALFLYPFVPIIYGRLAMKATPVVTSWLLPWDPLLLLGQATHRNWPFIIIGAPLLLIALTLIVGRAFCGWICPLGTILDLIRPLAFWQKLGKGPKGTRWFSPTRNSTARYYLLAAAVAGGFLSLQVLGTLDPLVILHRVATAATADAFALSHPAFRIYLSFSLVFLVIIVLELWQPRFWCRHLCPLGALLSIFSRWSLLNRRVTTDCNRCGDCRRECSMRAIPIEGHDTSYADCHFCLGCEGNCPRGAISFGFGPLATRRWQAQGKVTDAEGKTRLAGQYVAVAPALLPATRRQFLGGAAAAVTGLLITPLLRLAGKARFLRPPGALPEEQFLQTCILCQECIRVCPTSALKPVAPGAAPAGVGTPQLVPRQGACALTPSCPHLCAQVCPVGAIRPIQPAEMRLGIAVVEHAHCLAWDQGVKCLVCVEACLFEAAQAYNGRITVNPEKCTGCGRCENACPVAGSAIRVYPPA